MRRRINSFQAMRKSRMKALSTRKVKTNVHK
nr:MAG TPA: hypothetical protein [Caudoviricetes sp.]